MTVVVRTNMPEFERSLAEYKKSLFPIVAKASRAAAQEFAKAVRIRARRHTGRLRAAVVIKRAKRVPQGTVMYIVGIRQGKSQQRIQRKRGSVNLDAYYWRFLEEGWIPRGRGAGPLRGGASKKREAREAGKHRRVQYPFIKPAFEAAGGRALKIFYDKLEEATKG